MRYQVTLPPLIKEKVSGQFALLIYTTNNLCCADLVDKENILPLVTSQGYCMASGPTAEEAISSLESKLSSMLE